MISNKIKMFKKDDQGNIAILFAILLFPMILIVGGVIDYSIQLKHQHRLQASNDLAALAAAKAISKNMQITDGELQTLMSNFYKTNLLDGNGVGLALDEVEIIQSSNDVLVKREGSIDSSLLSIIGIHKLEIGAKTRIGLQSSNAEIALVVDVSGSMGSAGKIDALSNSSDLLVDLLIKNEGASSVRMALIPWNESVGLKHDAAKKHIFVSRGFGHDGCAVAGQAISLSDPLPGLAAIQGYAGCPRAALVPLTRDKNHLKSEINKWVAGGGTSSDTGLFWAATTLSPAWGSVWGGDATAKAPEAVKKIIVLMTDGANNGPESDQRSREICAALKKDDVVIYTIGFQLHPQYEQYLRDCATSDEHFIRAASNSALTSAFEAIGNSISNLYISE